jgi:hypothetical protein
VSENTYVDTKYYRAVPPRSLAERVFVAARDRIYADFIRLTRPLPADRLLDVGISDVVGGAANLLERLYPHPERISAVGIGKAPDFIAAFPAVQYRQVEPHQKLPFADRSVDIACSNAVIEHLGAIAHQRAFVSDIARVAKRVFLTVPNRFFPIEHHTALPLVAWTGASFSAACRLTNKSEWADEANLILMCKQRLADLCPAGRRMQIGYTGFKLGPFSSNIYLYLGD